MIYYDSPDELISISRDVILRVSYNAELIVYCDSIAICFYACDLLRNHVFGGAFASKVRTYARAIGYDGFLYVREIGENFLFAFPRSV